MQEEMRYWEMVEEASLCQRASPGRRASCTRRNESFCIQRWVKYTTCVIFEVCLESELYVIILAMCLSAISTTWHYTTLNYRDRQRAAGSMRQTETETRGRRGSSVAIWASCLVSQDKWDRHQIVSSSIFIVVAAITVLFPAREHAVVSKGLWFECVSDCERAKVL